MEQEEIITFTEIDSTTSLVQAILDAGYDAYESGGAVYSDIPDDVYRELMRKRGYVLDED